MNKVVKGIVAAVAFLGIFTGATACGTQGSDDVEYVYVNGYYDSHHHYHHYSHPHRVTYNYYTHHRGSYPKPSRTVKVHKTSKSTVRKSTRSTTRKNGSTSYKRSGGFSKKR